MKRTALVRKKPLRREGPSSAREDKPRADATPKPKKCCAPGCEREFWPRSTLHRACSQRCAMKLLKVDKRAEKEATKARHEKLKTITEWEHECKLIVQKIARIRDRDDGCISCHMGPDYKGRWHGSHFRPAGNHSAVELHLWNIHKSCAQCNKYKGGNIAGYRPRLIAKIGLERVEWLEAQNQPTKRTVDYLRRFKRVMGKRLRRLEKARAT